MSMLIYNKATSGDVYKALYSEIITSQPIGKKNMLNVGAAFDTETSSFVDETDGEYSAIVYVWMFGIGDTVIYGRELDEFNEMISMLNHILKSLKNRLIVYVHNLKYDFAFIKRLFEWETVFSKTQRDVLYAALTNIEFRDSLVLAGGRSLEYIGNHLRSPGFKKAVGDLDYRLIRHPQTPLTEKELFYCEMDIRVLCKYIEEKIQDDGDITRIPYTNTGYVRNYVRNACFEHKDSYLNIMDGLTLTPGAYQQAETAFIGGAVGANIKHIGKTFCAEPTVSVQTETVIGTVISRDIKSSYPYAMVTGYYPMSYATPVKNKVARDYLLNDKHCCMFDLEIWDLVPRADNDFCFPLSESKCSVKIGVRAHYGSCNKGFDDKIYRTGNGRIMTAMYIKTTCTELDFKTFKKFYDLDNCRWRVSHMRIYERGWLPRPIVEATLKFFRDKTTLDGVEGKEAEYMIAKNMLNAIYGMMVEKPVRPDYFFNMESGIINKQAIDYVEKVVRYNEKYSRFLYYPWGVYVTAHARWRLYDAINEVGKDFVYCDTDSVKYINADAHEAYFVAKNKEAEEKMIALAKRLRIPLSDALPTSPKGEVKCLGVWEKEWEAKRFKTLGAKRYLIEFMNGELYFTTAGTNKEYSLYYLINEQFQHGKDVFDNFNENLVIPAEYAKRLVATFIDEERYGWVTDYLGNRYYYNALSGIHMRPSSYSFSITDNTKEAIMYLIGNKAYEPGQIY